MDKNTKLYLNSTFTVKGIEANGGDDLPKTSDVVESIYIEGYASTNDIDRAGDVVSASVWEKGITNYLKNPIILANHDHDDPIGRMVEHRIDSKGLWIKARISAAAEIFNLVKDKVVTAFSIGFKIADAEYNSDAEIFMIKAVELLEISVVSIPCNQNTLFDLSKSFKDDTEYKKFKSQFAPKGDSAKGLESRTDAKSTSQKEWNMNPEEIQKMLAEASEKAALAATKALEEKQAAEKAAAEKAAAEQAAIDARVKAAVEAQIQVGQSGAEKLLAEVTKRFEDQTSASKSALEGLEAAIKEKTAELAKIQASKMNFSDKANSDASTYQEREQAILLSKISGKALQDTAYGRSILEKGAYSSAGQVSTASTTSPHVATGIWELEVSMNMEAEVRRRLVVAPLLRGINMKTNVMTIPVNPETGLATWVTNAQFGTTNSAGTNATHQLKEVSLAAYKVATNEYLNYEEEEDSLLVILPIVRDAMIRRLARAVDKAYLLGAGSGSDPIKGLATYPASTNVTAAAASGAATIAQMRALRKNLGAWGLDPAEVVYVVSTEVYYDLLDDSTFQTMNQVGQQATLLTGQVGQIGNSPVLVSAEFATKAAGVTGAIAFAPANFLAGNQRGLRFDTQELVETQRRVLVASMRTGMTRVTSNLGDGVHKFNWV